MSHAAGQLGGRAGPRRTARGRSGVASRRQNR